MANVYEGGKPDDRQSDSTVASGLFRKRYRQLMADEIAYHDAIKDKADELANLFANMAPRAAVNLAIPVPAGLPPLPDGKVYDGANVTLALRHLEDAVYRAVKALTG